MRQYPFSNISGGHRFVRVKLRRQEPGASSLHYYLDIGIKLGNVRKHFLSILLYPFNKYFSTISRDPDEMILRLIYGTGTFLKSHAP